MIYLTYNQTRGRNGHKLKDIMSVFILSFFLNNCKVYFHNSWRKQNILNNISLEKVSNNKNKNYKEKYFIDQIKEWRGIDYDTFQNTLEIINDLDDETLVVFKKVFRIHPYQLHNWYIEKKIKEDIFTNKFIPLLRDFYYGKEEVKLNDIFSIHIRRGDSAKKMIKEGWNINFYKNVISEINKKIDIPINIYSEKINSNDLLELKSFNNVNLILGDDQTFLNDFKSMATSKYLLISSSSLSTWLSYISIGTIFLPDTLNIKDFSHIMLPENFHFIRDINNIL